MRPRAVVSSNLLANRLWCSPPRRLVLGVGAEAKWMSESMEATLPAMWRDAKCGGTDAEAAGAPHFA